MNTPVLFLIFNRPDTTQRVFNEIRKVKPSQLFIAADGARKTHNDESERCQLSRDVATSIDWDCEVTTLFREKNLGCKIAISSAIDWFFDHVDAGIILEDDCIPNQSFFLFCEEMLERFKNERKVMTISGDNFQFGRMKTPYSYYFSGCHHLWGWATWKRAWNEYDVAIRRWPAIRDTGLCCNVTYSKMFESIYKNEVDTWDYQWLLNCLINGGLSVVPTKNLITNVGFTKSATHKTFYMPFANVPREELQFPLIHPDEIVRDIQADEYEQKIEYSRIGMLCHAIRQIGKTKSL